MSDSTNKAWYQDGFIVLCTIGFSALLLWAWLTPRKEFVDLEISGYRHSSVLGTPTLQVSVWHIFPGTLEKGRISVMAQDLPSLGHKTHKHHSFDAWLPNEDHAITFDLPLQDMEADYPIALAITIKAKNAETTIYTTEWTGKKWSLPLRNNSNINGK